MQCPTCDAECDGRRCDCGWAAGPSMHGTLPQPRRARPWKFCEWTTAHGTCGAPTGTHAEPGPLQSPRLCAWHRERELLSLRDLKQSERQVFNDWLTRFPAGTAYQPFPGIWDKDPETLWLLITGAIPFSEVEAQLCKRGVVAAKVEVQA